MSVAVITGASGGIGRAFALQLRDLGVRDFRLVARNEASLRALAEELAVPCKILVADLATAEGIRAVREALEEEKPTVSWLVNAAGFGRFGAFDVLPEQTVEQMIELNVKALVLLTHMIVPYMERGGHIIEMGSGSCFTPLPHFNIYASSKAFVLHYTKALRYELAPYGVGATCFCPGWVKTPFLPGSMSVPDALVPKSMNPLLDPDEVVRGCLRAARRGKTMYVTNWYTKLQHLLFKILPDGILSRAWLGMLHKKPSETDKM